MKLKELEVINYLNDNFKLRLKSTNENKVCDYDAYNNDYIVEIKCRNDYYNTKLK